MANLLRVWTDLEINFIKENFGKYGGRYCADKLGKKITQVQDIAKKYKIPSPKTQRKFIRPDNPEIKLLISWEEFDQKSYTASIPFNCGYCKEMGYTSKHGVKQALKKGFKNLYCCHACHGKSRITKDFIDKDATYIPEKEEFITLIEQDYCIRDMAEFYKMSDGRIKKYLNMYNLSTKFKWNASDETTKLKRIDTFRKHYYSGKILQSCCGISIPCEKIKRELREMNVSFKEEVMPLYHLGRAYRADILFEDYGVIVEINGNEHYKDKRNLILTDYFQERHNLLEQNGWRVLEIPADIAMANNFVLDLLKMVYDNQIRPNFKYKEKTIAYCRCGNEKDSDETYECNECYHKRRIKICPFTKEQLHWCLWNYDKGTLRKHFHINHDTLERWINELNIKETPKHWHWTAYRHGSVTDYQI